MADEPDTETVRDQLEELRECLDDLQDALGPLNLKDQTSTFASYAEQEKLDPIGKAKILVTLGYAIDSLLFCMHPFDVPFFSSCWRRASIYYKADTDSILKHI